MTKSSICEDQEKGKAPMVDIEIIDVPNMRDMSLLEGLEFQDDHLEKSVPFLQVNWEFGGALLEK